VEIIPFSEGQRKQKPAFILPLYSAPAKPLFFKGGGQGAEFMIYAPHDRQIA
jgi:hypothetical protein